MLKPEHFIHGITEASSFGSANAQPDPIVKKVTITVSCGFGHSATLDNTALFADDRGGRKGLGCWIGWVCTQCVTAKNVPREENIWTGKYDPAGWHEVRIDKR